MSTQFISGISYLFRGLALLNKSGIRRYVVVPLGLNIGLFGLGTWYAYGQFLQWLAWLEGYLPSWLHWLQWIIVPLFSMAIALAIFFTFSIIANIIAAPFNGMLAEQVEYHLTGRFPQDKEMSWGEIVIKAIPMIWNEISKMLYALVLAIPFLLLFVIPVINIAAPFFWIAYSSWMMAIQYLDIPMANHDIPGKQIRQTARSKRLLSMGFGAIVTLMTTIPFINFLVMPAAVAGATLLWVEKFLPEART